LTERADWLSSLSSLVDKSDERTKHVDIYYHYIKDQVKDGKIDLQYVPTAEMAADGLTKPLNKLKHLAWVAQVGLRQPLLYDDK
jgi:hypothetical protein